VLLSTTPSSLKKINERTEHNSWCLLHTKFSLLPNLHVCISASSSHNSFIINNLKSQITHYDMHHHSWPCYWNQLPASCRHGPHPVCQSDLPPAVKDFYHTKMAHIPVSVYSVYSSVNLTQLPSNNIHIIDLVIYYNYLLWLFACTFSVYDLLHAIWSLTPFPLNWWMNKSG